jgi:POT family proton-dependent oligopeptide transporter
MEAAIAAGEARPKRTFFGEPMGLAYLSFTEAWERFSYYGMTALLPLYLAKQLFQPGRIENIAGFGPFRDVVEQVFGKMNTAAELSSQVYGLYTGFVYMTPILGGIIADRWLGRRLSVALGAAMMSCGHLAMAFDQSFLLAFLLLVIGCGLLKGNISTQVGQLYAPEDGEGRTRGYSIYSIGINVGAVVGPIACAALAVAFGYHWGFGLAGVLMLFGLVTYLMGYRHFAAESAPAEPKAAASAPKSTTDMKVVLALIGVMAITVFQSIGYYQNTNLALTWIDEHVDRSFFGWDVPAEWFQSIDPFVSILIVPVLIGLWKWQDKHGGEPDEMGKICTGAIITTAANLVLIPATLMPGKSHVLFPIIYDVLHGIGFIYYWPTLLGLISGAAPPRLKSTMMGVGFLTLFVAFNLIGTIGRYYGGMTPTNFWLLHAGIAAIGVVLALIFGKPLMKILRTAEGTAA